jgi:hypothetical protein
MFCGAVDIVGGGGEMKEYRIVRTKPSVAIVNVRTKVATWTGYTMIGAANEDLNALRARYPEMTFEIVPYITLDVEKNDAIPA